MCDLCEELDTIFANTGGMETATHTEDLIIARFLSEGMPQDMDHKTRAALRRDFPEGLDIESDIFRHLMTMPLPPEDNDLAKIARLSLPENAQMGMYRGFNPFGDADEMEPQILAEITGDNPADVFQKLRTALLKMVGGEPVVFDGNDIAHLVTVLSMNIATADIHIERDGPSDFWEISRDRSQTILTKLAGVTSLVAPPF